MSAATPVKKGKSAVKTAIQQGADEQKKAYGRQLKVEESKEDEEVEMNQTVFGEGIAIKPAKQIKHNDAGGFFPPGHLSFVIYGISGTGKSSLACTILPHIANLHYVVICSLVPNNTMYDSIRKWCAKTKKVFALVNEPSEAESLVEELIESRAQREEETGEDVYGIIISDDFTQKASATDPYTRFMRVVSEKLRNERFHNLYITQQPQNLITSIRNNANVNIVFRLNNPNAVRIMSEEFVKHGLGEKEDYLRLTKLTQKFDFSYIFMVHGHGADKCYFYLPSADASAKPGEGRMLTAQQALGMTRADVRKKFFIEEAPSSSDEDSDSDDSDAGDADDCPSEDDRQKKLDAYGFRSGAPKK